jgi:hypothetical protein
MEAAMEPMEAQRLLQETESLRGRVSAERRWTWYPPVVFGLLIFAVMPLSNALYLLNLAATAWGGDSPDRAGTVVYLGNSLPLTIAVFYWPVAILAGYWIVARYRRRHRERTGLSGPAVWPYLIIGLFLCAVLVIEQRGMGWSMNPQYLGIGLTLLFMAHRERDRS